MKELRWGNLRCLMTLFKVRKWSVQRLTRLEEEQAKLYEEQNMMEELLQWIDTKEGILIEKENEPIPDDDYEQVARLLDDQIGRASCRERV